MNNCIHCTSKFTTRKQKKFCSIKCQLDYQYIKYIELWQNGQVSGEKYEGEVSSHVRRWLFTKYESKCCKCGWAEIHPVTNLIPLQVNHIDGNWSNHIPSNLELLCPNCHSMTPNYGNLNRGNGRKKRIGGA